MAIEDRDRIDIVATLHDRFNRPAEEIISKMEEMERQSDDTGDSIDKLEDKIDKETRTTRDSSKEIEKNTDQRRKSKDAIDDQADAAQRSARSLRDNNRTILDGLDPLRRHSERVKDDDDALTASAMSADKSSEAHRRHNSSVRNSTRSIREHTRHTERASKTLYRCTGDMHKSTEAFDMNSRAAERNRRETERGTRIRRKDGDEWSRWNKRVTKVTSNVGKRFRPIGAFYQNYFKMLGMLRGVLFSDIGALIPQIITGIMAIGSAAVASLAPAGRLLGVMGQMAPLLATFGVMKGVLGASIGSVGKTLKVLSNPKSSPAEIAKALKDAGKNTAEFALELNRIRKEFQGIGKSIREALWFKMADSVRELANVTMPKFEKHLTRAAELMNGSLREGMKGLTEPESQKTLDSVLSNSAVSSGLLVDALFSLLDIFLLLAEAAGPSLNDTLTSLNTKLDALTQWMRDHKEDLKTFFDSANRTAGNFLKGVGYIATGLYGLAQGAKPLEDFLYGGILDKLQGWSERMNDPKHQEEMAKNYESMIPNLEAIGNLIGSIVEGASEIAASPWFAPLINDLADNGIPMLVDLLKGLDGVVSPNLLRLSEVFSSIDMDNKMVILQPLGDLLSALASFLEVVVPLFNELPDPVQKFVFYLMGLAALGLPGILMLLVSPLSLINQALVWLTGKGILKWVWEGLKKIGKAAKSAGEWLDKKLSPAFKWLGKQAKNLWRFLSPVFKPIIDFVAKHAGKFLKFLSPVLKFLGKKSFAIIPVVGTLIAILWTVWDVLSWLWNNVKPFRDFFTAVWEWIVVAWNASINWIVNTAVPWIVGAFQAIWDGIKKVGEWLLNFYNSYVKPVIDAIVWLGKLVFVVVGTLIIAPFVILWNILSPIFKWLWDQLAKYLPMAFKWFVDASIAAWDWLVQAWNYGKLIFGIVVGAIVLAATWLWTQVTNIVTWIVNAWNASWKFMGEVINLVWNWIKFHIIAPVVIWFLTYVWPMIKWVIDQMVNAWNWLKAMVGFAWNWIKYNIIAPVVVWFLTNVWPNIRNVISWLGDKFNWLKDRVSTVWSAIKNVISNVYNNNIKPIFDAFKRALTSLETAFTNTKNAIGRIWEGVKEKVRGPAQYVVDVVYNNGIRAVWNKLAKTVNLGSTLDPITFGGGGGEKSGTKNMGGGKTAKFDTGGYTGPGSKYMPAGIVHADEFVIRKESQMSLRRKAPGFLDLLNRYGARALNMVGVPGYDGGGKVKKGDPTYGLGTNPGSRSGVQVGDGDSSLSITNPFEGLVDKYTKGIRDKFPAANKFVDIGVGLVKKFVIGAKDFVATKIGQAWDTSVGAAGNLVGQALGAASGLGGWGKASRGASLFGMRVTSTFRRGARTAQSGMTSLHALGRAKDYAGSASNMMKFFNYMDSKPYPTELLYSPAGGRNIHRSGRRYPNTGATLRNHYSHVHVGFQRGGLVNHMRFMGGPVETWGNTLVGEFGPELFMPSDGSQASLVGLHGPELLSFNREGAIAPHRAVAALSNYNEHLDANRVEHHETSHYDVSVTVGGNASELDVQLAVERAIAQAERKKRERR